MTQPDQQAYNTDSLPDTPVAQRNSRIGFLNRIPRPLLYGSVAAGLIGGIAAWYLVFGNQSAEPVAETPQLTQTPTNQVNPTTIPTTGNPVTTPSNTVDPTNNLSRALEVQDIPFLVTAEGSNSSGSSSGTSEAATPRGNGNQSTAGLNPFAPIPTPPTSTDQVQPPAIQQPNVTSMASNPNNSLRIPPTLRPTPSVTPQPSTSAPTISIVRPSPLPKPTSGVQKPPQLTNGKPSGSQTTNSSKGNPTNTAQTNQKPASTNQKPVQKPTVPTVQPSPPTPQTPITPQEPVVITTRPDIRIPNATSNSANLPIAVGGGVLPVTPQIIQKVNPPQVPQVPVVVQPQPQPQPTKPLELPNEGGVITPDASNTSSGLKPSTNNNAPSSQVDPLNTTIIPVKPQPPVVVVVVTPPVTPPVVTPVEPQPVRSILNEFVTERQLRYLDYVGGPFPQARLEIKGKSVIVGLGETIPDSKVVVKSITASEMVLLLGEETLTIPRTDK